jgi:hypothetical protein
MKTKILKEKDFDKKYQYDELIKSESFGNDGRLETYGKDLIKVMAQDNNKIWTMVDGDNGMYLVAGYHFVNRIYYVITKEPWDSPDEEYLIERY